MQKLCDHKKFLSKKCENNSVGAELFAIALIARILVQVYTRCMARTLFQSDAFQLFVTGRSLYVNLKPYVCFRHCICCGRGHKTTV